MSRYTITFFIASAVPVFAQVVSYEGTSFPEDNGWERIQVLFPGERWLDDGWLYQLVELLDPPERQQDFYKRSLAKFSAAETFFVQWRIETDGPREGIPNVSPASLVAGGRMGIFYHFTIAEDQVRFIDSDLSVLLINIEPGVPHTYYLELHGTDSYVWYIDGTPIDAADPEGPYPTSDSRITFGARAGVEDSTTRWDYIRYGPIPQPASGDFDSDGDVDSEDLYFFNDCLLGPDADGPGCLWADMNDDRKVSGADIPAFVDALLAPELPPPPAGKEHGAPPRPGVRSVSFDARPGR
jgi:hypothetical protein